MKIQAIKTFLMHVGAPPADAPERAEFRGTRNWLFVKVETDEGIVGLGECSGWPRVVQTAVQDLEPLLVGEDPMHTERLWQKMQTAIMGHGMTGTVGAGAMTGIDMALWDIKGKSLGTPVWNLLGGKVRDRIRVYGHANTPAGVDALREHGYTAFKVSGLKDTVRRVAQLRDHVGGDVDMMVDLHGPPWLSFADAAAYARALQPYDLLFLEDPVAPENLEGYARIRATSDIPLAAGERMVTIFGMRELIERKLVDVIQPDTGRAGGLTQMKKIAALAEAHHVMVAPHSGSLGPVAEFAALHLLASIPNALMLERIESDWPGRARTVIPHPRVVDGFISVPDGPGLGVEIDEDFVAAHPSMGNVSVPTTPSSGDYQEGTFNEHVYVQTRLGRRRQLSASADG